MSSKDPDKIEQRIEISGQAGNVTQIGKIVFRVTQFANEKIFKRFGLEQRVGFILLGVLVIGSAFALFWTLRPQSPVHMTGDFRIAVAGFAENGQSSTSEIGEELAQGVYLRLQQTFEESDMDFTVSIWGPRQVGVIEGESEEERTAFAARIAATINADVVVYGLIDTTETFWTVTPEFYVSTKNFYEANEIVGQHAMGSPFYITGQGNIANRIQVSDKYGSRVKVLSRITVGLAYYAIQDFAKALTIFQSIEGIEDWEEDEGKKVLYLLIGNTAAKTGNLELAETYYQDSLSLDLEYARAYLGLADVYYLRALQPFHETNDPTSIDSALISRSIVTYEQAGKAAHQPPLADIPTKMRFGLGQSYLVRVYSGDEDFFDQAIDEFKAVIQEYGGGTNPRVRELAAESHARLGLIYDLSGQTDLAIQEYQAAIFLLDNNPTRRTLYEQKLETLTKNISR